MHCPALPCPALPSAVLRCVPRPMCAALRCGMQSVRFIGIAVSKGPIERTADRTDVDSAVLADRIEAVLLDAVALPETQPKPKPKPTPAGAQRPKLLVRKAASREYCCAALFGPQGPRRVVLLTSQPHVLRSMGSRTEP